MEQCYGCKSLAERIEQTERALDAEREKVAALQRERDDAIRAANGMSNDLTSIGTERDDLQAALDAERDDIKMAKEVYDSTIVELRKHLSQLQALVRALPIVPECMLEGYMRHLRIDDSQDYVALAAVLRYRATVDRTPTKETTTRCL